MRAARLVKRKDAIPIVLHVHDGPSVHSRGVQSLIELAKIGVSVIGVFAPGVSVMDDETESHCTGSSCPLKHLEVPIRVTKRGDRPLAYVLIDSDRLASLIIDKVNLWEPKQKWLTITHLKSSLNRRPDDLFGRDPVDPICPRAHEFDSASRDNERFETVRA
jgi:hypothetical protein